MSKKAIENQSRPLVERDAYDRAAFSRAAEESLALARAIDAGTALVPHFEGFVQDIFSVLFKYAVVHLPSDAPSQELPRRMLQWVLSTNGFDQLKAETTLDEVRAGHATLRLTEHVLGVLRDPERFSQEELLEGFEAARLEEEIDNVQSLLEDLEQIDGTEQADGTEQDDGTEPADAGETDSNQAGSSGQKAEGGAPGKGFKQALRNEKASLERALVALAQAQARRLERLPAKVESDLRQAINTLPDEMKAEEEAAENFAGSMGIGADSLDARAKLDLGRRLLDNQKLERLGRLAGAFREYALGLRKRPFEKRASEIHSLDLGNDPGRILPNELALLRHRILRRWFLARWIDAGLLQYAIEAEDNAGSGAIVLCLDGSSSMQGDKEMWAKAVALTLLELCRRERRPFTAIVFSSRSIEIRTFDLVEPGPRRSIAPPEIPFETLVDFAEYFPRGGTRFQEPLERALEILEREPKKRGDIVLITDGESHLPEPWIERFDDARKTLGFKLHSVLVDVGSHRAELVQRISDTCLSVTDLSAESAGDLFTMV